MTRCLIGLSQLETGCRSKNQLQTEGFGTLVTLGWATQAKMRKKNCYGRGRTWVNIAIRLCLHSFLTHNKHHLFENKVWEMYVYIKKCIRSLLKSSLSVDYDPVYIFICIRAVVCGYTTVLSANICFYSLIMYILCSTANAAFVLISTYARNWFSLRAVDYSV